MSTLKPNQPIGIFDSGIGGLTVAKAIAEALPGESIIYFGDTVHLPYGEKSPQVIQDYAKKIIDFLLACDVKLILIACNSASAAAYEVLTSYVGRQTLLFDVINPVVSYLDENYAGKRIGLIGTKLTVQSRVYHKKITALTSKIDLCSLATPLLVPIIEEGLFEHELIDVALNEYLKHPTLQNIEALVLGCTHYPVIKKSISSFYGNRVDIIDAGKIVADAVKAKLTSCRLLSSVIPKYSFYVSDLTKGFAKGARLFFGEDVQLELKHI